MTYKIVLSVVFFLGAASAHAALPALPQAQVDTTMPTTSITKTVCASGCDYTNSQLQTALDDAVLGTTILLQPGVTYTPTVNTGFALRNKTSGSGWIILKTNTTLPAEGVRAIPADAVNYAKIVRGSLYAMSADATAHHYRIIGIEFMNPGNVDLGSGGGAFFNSGVVAETSSALQNHHIIFDRIYMHGPPAGHSFGVLFGIILNGQYEAVIESTIIDMTPSQEAKGVAGWWGVGPFLVRNSAVSSSGENIYWGGAIPLISGLIPADITIINNHIYKPLKWRDDPAYNTNPNKILVKNLYENKSALRQLVNGNTFENMWPGAQVGFAMTITPRQGNSSTDPDIAPWTTVQDLTITNNLFKNTANGIALAGGVGNAPPTTQGGRILVKNNLFISNGGYLGTGLIFQMSNGAFDVIIQHNTVASFSAFTPTVGKMITFTDSPVGQYPMTGFVVKDNFFLSRSYSIFVGGCNSSQLAIQTPGYVWTNNIFAGPWPSSAGCASSLMPQGNGNAYPASESLIQYSDAANGDYSLAAGSPYNNAASDGTDIGVNWSELRAAQQGTSTGGTDRPSPQRPVGLKVQ